jgi:hypothetical protein
MPQVADVSHWLWHRPWSLVRDTGNVGKQRQWMLKACSYDPFTSVGGSGSVGSLPVASHLYTP